MPTFSEDAFIRCFRVARDSTTQMLSYDSRERVQVSGHPLVSYRSTSIAQTAKHSIACRDHALFL